MAVIYAVHPSGSTTALQLATLYGLTNPADYIVVSNDAQPPAGFIWSNYINLYVREDGHYPSIKYELGDERDGIARYQGGYLWNEARPASERKRATGEDRH